MARKIIRGILTGLIALLSLCLTAMMIFIVVMIPGKSETGLALDSVDSAIMDRFDMYMTNRVSGALDGIVVIEKVYWLSDSDKVAPKPDPDKFGETKDPASLGWLLEEAAPLLDGQETLFNVDTPIKQGSTVTYYLDETIFAVTWKQPFHKSGYTISEIKIAHPSQLRRFLSGGQYASGVQKLTTEMAKDVNSVVASSGDFYSFRRKGIIVYEETVQRVNSEDVDTCYIDDKGNLLFSYRGELPDMESAQQFVDDNNIRFSLSFGPILIDNGEAKDFKGYSLGEVDGNYTRAAICQLDELHYLLVIAGQDPPHIVAPVLTEFQDVLMSFGCDMAYTLDGGQTATIVMNNKMINRVLYGYQERNISDIVYFATAIPESAD